MNNPTSKSYNVVATGRSCLQTARNGYSCLRNGINGNALEIPPPTPPIAAPRATPFPPQAMASIRYRPQHCHLQSPRIYQRPLAAIISVIAVIATAIAIPICVPTITAAVLDCGNDQECCEQR